MTLEIKTSAHFSEWIKVLVRVDLWPYRKNVSLLELLFKTCDDAVGAKLPPDVRT